MTMSKDRVKSSPTPGYMAIMTASFLFCWNHHQFLFFFFTILVGTSFCFFSIFFSPLISSTYFLQSRRNLLTRVVEFTTIIKTFRVEPTSGLDAGAVDPVMRTGSNTLYTRRAVVCVIPQPIIDTLEALTRFGLS